MKKNLKIVSLAAAALLTVSPVVASGANIVNAADITLQPSTQTGSTATHTVFSVNNQTYGNKSVLPLNVNTGKFQKVDDIVNAINKLGIKVQTSSTSAQHVDNLKVNAGWVIQQLQNNNVTVSGNGGSAKFSNLPEYMNFTLSVGDASVILPLSHNGSTTEADVTLPQINVSDTKAGQTTATPTKADNGTIYRIAQNSNFNPLDFTTIEGDHVTFSAQQTSGNTIVANVSVGTNPVNTSEAGHFYTVTLKATNSMNKTATLSYTVMVVPSGEVTLSADTTTYRIYGNNPSADTTLKAGTKIYVGSTTQTIGNDSYTKISTTSKADADRADNNLWVKTSDLTAKPAEQSQTHRVMVTSKAYDKNGNYLGHNYDYNTNINIVPTVVNINGKTYYKVAGKDEYVRVTNITGTPRRLRHNAYVYWSSYRRNWNGKIKYYRGETVNTYGAAMTFRNGKKYYRIDGCSPSNKRYLKVANF